MGGHNRPIISQSIIGIRYPCRFASLGAAPSIDPLFIVNVTTHTHRSVSHCTCHGVQKLSGPGGAAFFSDGSCVWFQFQITLEEASTRWAWVDQDMQKHFGAWELLAQYALTYCIEAALPRCRNAVSCIQGVQLMQLVQKGCL